MNNNSNGDLCLDPEHRLQRKKNISHCVHIVYYTKRNQWSRCISKNSVYTSLYSRQWHGYKRGRGQIFWFSCFFLSKFVLYNTVTPAVPAQSRCRQTTNGAALQTRGIWTSVSVFPPDLSYTSSIIIIITVQTSIERCVCVWRKQNSYKIIVWKVNGAARVRRRYYSKIERTATTTTTTTAMMLCVIEEQERKKKEEYYSRSRARRFNRLWRRVSSEVQAAAAAIAWFFI